jgi:hypothetical protein
VGGESNRAVRSWFGLRTLNVGGRPRRYGVPPMGQVEARRGLVVGAVAFVVVGVALYVLIGLPT